ncbi:MAG TPA: hypothetical protein VE033_02085 [Acetobacteraceae bacterium]|jgi:hypothetical protein|nr:hypothetical protein [Acetobacteraceae bacterium]
MLKGTIEAVSREEISGWIHVEGTNIRDSLILAFVGDDCVGAGKVGLFRQDLAEAGLADGHLGFSFPIRIADDATPASVVVRLDGSDAVLIQRTSRVTGQEAVAVPAGERGAGQSLSSLRWMRGQGWLSQPEYDFLRIMQQFGAYDLSTRPKRSASPSTEPPAATAAKAARTYLGLRCANEVELQTIDVANAEDLAVALAEVARMEAALNVVAVWSETPGSLDVVEGSHLAPGAGDTAGAIQYPIGPERVLFLDLRTAVGYSGTTFPKGVQVLYGVMPA